MVSSARYGKIRWLLAGLLIFAVAFIGAVAGKRFAEWRQDRAHREKLERLYSRNPAKLKIGDILPRLELVDLEDNVIDTKAIVDGHKALIFFLEPACDMCSELIEAYRKQMDHLPTELSIFGICPDSPATARSYTDEHELPFPLYCDTIQSFQANYGVIAFPTLMALDKNGVIRYINFGMAENYAFEDIIPELDRF